MLKAGDFARSEDRRVRGVKIGKTRRDRGISHVCYNDVAGLIITDTWIFNYLNLSIYGIMHFKFTCLLEN